jgi:hypothetical protein
LRDQPFSQQTRLLEQKLKHGPMDLLNIGSPVASTTARHSMSPGPTRRHLLDTSNSGPDANSTAAVGSIADGFLASNIDDDAYVEVENTHDSSVLEIANIHRCSRLLPITLDGSPSPIEPLPPPFLLARAPTVELDEWRNSGAKHSYSRSTGVSGTVIGLGVGPASLRTQQEVSLLTKTVVSVASATPKVHSPLAPQRSQVRSPHCRDEGRNPGLSIASPLQKTSPLHHSAYRPTQVSPTTEPLLRHAGSHSAQVYAISKPSSPDLKHLLGRNARKRPRSRSVRAPENTPPTPKSPQFVEKVTTSPLTISTNHLDTGHALLQGSIQIRETFACYVSGQDAQSWVNSTILHEPSAQARPTSPAFPPVPHMTTLQCKYSDTQYFRTDGDSLKGY